MNNVLMIVAPLRSDLEAPLLFEQCGGSSGMLPRRSSAGGCDPEAIENDLSIRPVMSEPQSNFFGLQGFYNQDIPPRSVANAQDSLYGLFFIRNAHAGVASHIARAG
jgi:hypothetical protein